MSVAKLWLNTGKQKQLTDKRFILAYGFKGSQSIRVDR